MRTIKQTAAFKRDFKRESKGQHREFLLRNFEALVRMLANDEPLGPQHRDHPLPGEWKDHRDCHLRPDLVLIYRKLDSDTLYLVRLGSHAELSL